VVDPAWRHFSSAQPAPNFKPRHQQVRTTRSPVGARIEPTRAGRPQTETQLDHLQDTPWAAANNVELAYTPTSASWLNRIEAQFTALRYFTLDGTDHGAHREQASMVRRCIASRNRHARDQRLSAS